MEEANEQTAAPAPASVSASEPAPVPVPLPLSAHPHPPSNPKTSSVSPSVRSLKSRPVNSKADSKPKPKATQANQNSSEPALVLPPISRSPSRLDKSSFDRAIAASSYRAARLEQVSTQLVQSEIRSNQANSLQEKFHQLEERKRKDLESARVDELLSSHRRRAAFERAAAERAAGEKNLNEFRAKRREEERKLKLAEIARKTKILHIQQQQKKQELEDKWKERELEVKREREREEAERIKRIEQIKKTSAKTKSNGKTIKTKTTITNNSRSAADAKQETAADYENGNNSSTAAASEIPPVQTNPVEQIHPIASPPLEEKSSELNEELKEIPVSMMVEILEPIQISVNPDGSILVRNNITESNNAISQTENKEENANLSTTQSQPIDENNQPLNDNLTPSGSSELADRPEKEEKIVESKSDSKPLEEVNSETMESIVTP